MEKEYTENIIPVMTSESTPSGNVSSDGALNMYWYAFQAFDRGTSPYGWISSVVVNSWIQYKFDTGKKIKKYTISNVKGPNSVRYLRKFSLKASNTGLFIGEEVTLDTQSGLVFGDGEKKTFICSNNATIPYLYYRITDISSTPSIVEPAIGEIEMMEEVIKTKYFLKQNNQFYTFDGTNIILSPSQILDEANFKTNGFNDTSIITKEQLGKAFKDKTELKLLLWTEDLTKTNVDMVYNCNTFRPLDKFDKTKPLEIYKCVEK